MLYAARVGAKRLASTVCGIAAVFTLLASAPPASATRTVVGGAAAQPQSAPWTVLIRQAASPSAFLCGGSIVDSLHVVTAAHCVYDRGGAQAPTTAFLIRAGISNYRSPVGADEQDSLVSSIRVHPGYRGPGAVSPDDVAVIALATPLDLSGPAVKAIALPLRGATFPAGSEVVFAGFGRAVAGSPADGSLNWLTAKVDEQGDCGGFSNTVIPRDDAVALCATAPGMSLCNGDSGSGLVTTRDPVTLVGVVSAGSTLCERGSSGVFTYLGAPEILAFVQGDDHPPVAPRKAEPTFVKLSWSGDLGPGSTLTCAAGNWDGAATFSYSFVNATTGQVLQQGPSATFVVTPSEVHGSVYCRAFATSGGGTGSLRTGSTDKITAAPTVQIGQFGKLLATRGKTVTLRVLVNTSRPGLSGKLGVCVTPPALVASRVCSSGRIDESAFGLFPVTLRLRIKSTAPLGATHVAVTAVAGISQSTTVATVSVGRA